MASPGTFEFLTAPAYRASLVRLVALMAASALTEGFGLLLLVPMLEVLGDRGGGNIAHAIAATGIPLSLGPLLGIFVALVMLRALIGYARSVAGQKFENLVVDGLRARAWGALLHCEWRTLSELRSTGSASLLITNIDRIGFGTSQVLSALSTLLTLAGIALAALAIAPLVAIVAAGCGCAVLFAYRRMRRRAAALGEALGAAYDDVYAQFGEGLGALRVIKSFGREDQTALRGAAAISGMRSAQLAFIHDLGKAQVALQGGGAVLLAMLVWLAITRWGAGATQVLPLVALFARALPLLGGLQQAWQNWAHARPALDATMALIATAEGAREPDTPNATEIPRLGRSIEVREVTVTHAGRAAPALDRVSATIPARKVTALAGASGAGKSTLADILGGLISPDSGSIAVDGVEIDADCRRVWRSRVAYVQQEPVLFTGTIRENLLWAEPQADSARLHDVLEAASAGFVEDLPDGLDTRVGEGGRGLSGGERQRIVLARALLREPELLILDEAASALDAENEAAIAEAVGRLRSRLTIVIIGHRGPLGALADQVIELVHGRTSA